MPEVRVFNPSTPTTINPRRAKPWTEKQASARKDQAERFVRDVLEDDDRADEIADMSPEQYAAERGKQIMENPERRSMRRRSSASQDDDSPTLQTNAKLSVANNKLADQLADKQKEIDTLQAKNAALQSRLDEIDDIVTCTDPECTAEEHLQDIQDVVAGNGGNGHDDDDD